MIIHTIKLLTPSPLPRQVSPPGRRPCAVPAKLLTPSRLPRQAKVDLLTRLLPLSPPVCCVVCVFGVARVWRNEQSLYRYSITRGFLLERLPVGA